jgi:uncharacterized membrane protein/protein-disulfide isomerase
MTARTRLLILCFVLIGLGFSGWATMVHHRLVTQPNYVSPCDINATFNCSELYLSQYGSVGGVSTALLGVFFFLAVGLIAALSPATINPREQAATTYVFVLSTIGLAVVLYLGWASYFVLQKFCLLCIGTYAAVVGLFIVSGVSGSLPVAKLPGRIASDLGGVVQKPARLFAALFMVAFTVSMVGCFPQEGEPPAAVGGGAVSGAAATGFEAAWAAQPRRDLGIPTDGAKVVVVKFNDYQCPSCKASHYAYKPVLDKFARENPGAVKYVVKDYPLSSRCNFQINGMGHAAACEAAAAARLAAEHGKQDAMVDWLFTNQGTLTPQSIEAQVKTMLGINDFTAQYARVLPDIKRDISDGATVQIEVTPTYYVNGVKAQTPPPDRAFLSPAYFEQAIQYEIKKADEKTPEKK